MHEITLWATKKGAPEWQEVIITSTDNTEKLKLAEQWAKDNGFDRLRKKIFTWEKPDFTKIF